MVEDLFGSDWLSGGLVEDLFGSDWLSGELVEDWFRSDWLSGEVRIGPDQLWFSFSRSTLKILSLNMCHKYFSFLYIYIFFNGRNLDVSK